MASTSPGQLPDEQTCTGLGLVKFDWAPDGDSQASLGQAPEVRCFGRRLSQEAAAAGWPSEAGALGRGRSSGTGGRSTAAEDQSSSITGGSTYMKVAEPTWALICAGQLRVRSAANRVAAGHHLGQPSAASVQQIGPAAMPCHVRCQGISLRLERGLPDADAGHTASRPEEVGDGPRPVMSAGPLIASVEAFAGGAAMVAMQDIARTAWRNTQAVVDRAGSILLSVQGAAHETSGPVRFTSDMVGATQKICTQAGKIAARSAEQVGRLASLPLRLRSGGEAAAGGSSGPPGSEPRQGGG